MKDFFDTIAAIATPPGKGSLSVIKISGSKAIEYAQKCFITKIGKEKDLRQLDRKLLYGYAVDPNNRTVIDECILLTMLAPKSYTGEDVVEFQCHGGNISSYKIIKALFALGARQAAPGEFTLRAFLNGKKDLLQAEAVNALVSSSNEFLHKNALLQLKGSLSERLESVFEELRRHYIALEADINFPEDVSYENSEEIYTLLDKAQEILKGLEKSYLDTAPLREGIKAIILGKPNVGKSTFLNKVLDYERAIVTPQPGTTRDFIVEQINFCGLPIHLIDTAGIRETDDPVEKIGIEKTISLLSEAEVVFLILDTSAALTHDDDRLINLLGKHKKALVLCLLNKIDKGNCIDETKLPPSFLVSKVSLKTGEGFESFKELFRKQILNLYELDDKEEVHITLPRHYEVVKTMLNITEGLLSEPHSLDRLLFGLKELITCYDNLLGKTLPPDEIEQIFSTFCIGK
ncbi:MAG: tRNA uridine-5-carboxymethylaminomethyl(34) synthesis GTPase MnmE [bacterium]